MTAFPGDDPFSEREERLKTELAPGERLAWAGGPEPRLYSLRTLPTALGGLFFSAFILVWIVSVIRVDRGDRVLGLPMFALPGIGMLLVGLGMLGSPLWAWVRARRTLYAVTDRRALIVEPRLLGGTIVSEFEPSALGSLKRVEHRGGSGDLVFREVVSNVRKGHQQVKPIGFLSLGDVRAVEAILRQTLRQS